MADENQIVIYDDVNENGVSQIHKSKKTNASLTVGEQYTDFGAPESLLTNEDPLKYPFLEVEGGYLKFPRSQLFRQNSKLAILVAEPLRHVTVEVTRNPSVSRQQVVNRARQDEPPEVPHPPAEVLTTKSEPPPSSERAEQSSSAEGKLLVAITKITTKGNGTHIKVKTRLGLVSNAEPDANDKTIASELGEIGHRLLDISKDYDFLHLEADDVCALLSSDGLDVSDESIVFRAAHRWLRFQPRVRLKEAGRVMGCVRFGLIKPKDLVKCYARGRSLGLLENAAFCEKLFVGLLWSTATHYLLQHLVPELKPEPRTGTNSDDDHEDAHLASCSSSAASLVSFPAAKVSGDSNQSDNVLKKKIKKTNDGSTVILIGGVATPDNKTYLIPGSQVLYYHPDYDQWLDMKPFPTPLCFAAACYVESSDSSVRGLYVSGGCYPKSQGYPKNLQAIATLWKYRPETTLWIRLAEMKEARMQHSLVTLPIANNGAVRILAIGGTDRRQSLLSDVESYNPMENVWRNISKLPYLLRDMTAMYHKGKVWVCGGYSERVETERSFGIVDTVLSFSWSQQRWTYETPLRVPRAQAKLVSDGELLYIVGGLTSTGGGAKETVEPSVDYLVPDLSAWRVLTEMPTPRYGATCFISKGRLLVVLGGLRWNGSVGGRSSVTNVVESYDLEKRRWVGGEVVNLPRRVDAFCATALPHKYLYK